MMLIDSIGAASAIDQSKSSPNKDESEPVDSLTWVPPDNPMYRDCVLTALYFWYQARPAERDIRQVIRHVLGLWPVITKVLNNSSYHRIDTQMCRAGNHGFECSSLAIAI